MHSSKTIYALLTRKCNLSCPHCDVYNVEDNFNREKFLDTLFKTEGNIILFGGEPTIYQDRLFDIVNECDKADRNIVSISTNMMILNDKLIDYYNKLGRVATSWNPNRFNKIQYDVWYRNCFTLSTVTGVKPTILITLDNDLLEMGVDNFLKVIDDWDSSVFKQIKLEHFNGDTTPEYFERVDNFLCELHHKWRSSIHNEIVDRVKHWWCDCSGVYTLNPDGTLSHGCPHNVTLSVPVECYTCERADICRPCVLQKYCSFPNKFAELVNSEGGNKIEV